MRTVKWNLMLSGAAALVGVVFGVAAARADVTSTNPAAILVFPKLTVDTTAQATDGQVTDTLIQISNTADNPVNVRCFYINTNGHCSNNPAKSCDPDYLPSASACSGGGQIGICVRGWQETDFAFRLTSKQPIAWALSEGLADLPLANSPGPKGEFNSGSIPVSPDNPMLGELKCIEVGDDELPVDSNDLVGVATIEDLTTTSIDARSYNAIGIQAIEGQNNRDNTLVLGQEYNGCPNILVLDHFFDGATASSSVGGPVTTYLTLVPCSENFNYQVCSTVTAQYLVFNEFEQRFSTSRPMQCFSELLLSDTDTRLGNADGNDNYSIFSAAVQGTLTGQTTVRGVQTASQISGTGLLAITEEWHDDVKSNAVVAHQRGVRTQPDIILLPAAQPSGL